MPTGDLADSVAYGVGAGVVAGVAIGALNRKRASQAASRHEKVTLEDLEG